jgi:Mrp family chromosome partitioning ATPase
MNLETIDPSTEIDVHRRWRPDAEASACFQALFRRLLLQPGPIESTRAVGITSCQHGAGVGTVASGLAIAAAGDGEQRVPLVDASPKAPAADRDFKIDQAPELLDAVRGSDSLEQVLRPSFLDNLWLLSVGMALSQARLLGAVLNKRQEPG